MYFYSYHFYFIFGAAALTLSLYKKYVFTSINDCHMLKFWKLFTKNWDKNSLGNLQKYIIIIIMSPQIYVATYKRMKKSLVKLSFSRTANVYIN